jgi:hypothetical protein
MTAREGLWDFSLRVYRAPGRRLARRCRTDTAPMSTSCSGRPGWVLPDCC